MIILIHIIFFFIGFNLIYNEMIFLKQYNGQQGAAQLYSDIEASACHIEKVKVWDVEVNENTAIALVIGHTDIQQSNNETWMEVSSLWKNIVT